MNKTLAVAGIVIKELYRRKDFYVLFVLTAVITLATGAVNFFHDDKIVRFVKDACMLLIWVSTLIIAIVTTARQIPAERESRTIFPLLAKPVSRAQVIVGKFLGCWVATGLALLVFYTFFIVISGSRELNWPLGVYFEGAWMQWLMLGIVIAATLWGSIHLAAPSSTITITFVVVVSILMVGRYLKTIALHHTEPTQTALTALYYLIPHLEWYDLRDFVVYDQKPAPVAAIFAATLYAWVWSAFFLVLACVGFRRKSLTT